MEKKTLIFLVIRIIAYVIVSISYTNHGYNLWLLLFLFLLIELQVWISFFAKRRIKNADDGAKKLLEDMKENLLKNQ